MKTFIPALAGAIILTIPLKACEVSGNDIDAVFTHGTITVSGSKIGGVKSPQTSRNDGVLKVTGVTIVSSKAGDSAILTQNARVDEITGKGETVEIGTLKLTKMSEVRLQKVPVINSAFKPGTITIK